MDEGNEGNEGSERQATVSPAASETPTEPSERNEPAPTPPAGADSPVLASSSLPRSSDSGSFGAEPSTVQPIGAEPAGEAFEAAEPFEGVERFEPFEGVEPFEAAAAPSRRRRRTTAVFVAGVLVVVLIAAAAGFASADGHHRSNVSVPSSISTTLATSLPPSPGDSTSSIVRLLDPAVVDINTINQTDTGYAIAAATGMIVSSDGFIVTNNHVVEEATSIKVAIEGHASQYEATFVGADPAADVALIKVDGLTGLPTVHFGNSSTISVGDRVVAIGNAEGRGGKPAVTAGTISALGQAITAGDEITAQPEHLTGMIETSATIVPGNSGGPLVDDHGLVIGMNTAADPGGYALPIDRVSAIASAIEHRRSGGGVVLGLRAFLGVVGQIPKSGTTPDGVDITRVVLGDPAAQAGIEPGDVVVDFDGKSTPNVFDLQRLVLARQPGDAATVTFNSPNGLETVSVRLAEGPAP